MSPIGFMLGLAIGLGLNNIPIGTALGLIFAITFDLQRAEK